MRLLTDFRISAWVLALFAVARWMAANAEMTRGEIYLKGFP